jgi:hypothetical protein
MRKQVIYILFFFVFSLSSNAQNKVQGATLSSSLLKHHALLCFSPNLNLTQTQAAPGSPPLLKHAYGAHVIPSGSIKDMPFFCAMECRLRERTRLWIKFRTGDDASYEKLIHSGGK